MMEANLEHRLTEVEVKTEQNTARIDRHDIELKDIVKLLSERPTWLTTTVITILSTVTSSLIVYVSMVHH